MAAERPLDGLDESGMAVGERLPDIFRLPDPIPPDFYDGANLLELSRRTRETE